MFKAWKADKDERHREECEKLGIFPAVWRQRRGRLPWRIPKDGIKVLDERARRIVWPHYIERMCSAGASWWVEPGKLWKCRRKIRLLYYILPTQLRDQVPPLRYALCEFVWAMRQLMGQVYSYNSARRLNILPGSRTVDKRNISAIHSRLIRALCLIEGCIPVSHINPGMHHFTHYAQYTKTHGNLLWYWMMAFERFEMNEW